MFLYHSLQSHTHKTHARLISFFRFSKSWQKNLIHKSLAKARNCSLSLSDTHTHTHTHTLVSFSSYTITWTPLNRNHGNSSNIWWKCLSIFDRYNVFPTYDIFPNVTVPKTSLYEPNHNSFILSHFAQDERFDWNVTYLFF